MSTTWGPDGDIVSGCQGNDYVFENNTVLNSCRVTELGFSGESSAGAINSGVTIRNNRCTNIWDHFVAVNSFRDGTGWRDISIDHNVCSSTNCGCGIEIVGSTNVYITDNLISGCDPRYQQIIIATRVGTGGHSMDNIHVERNTIVNNYAAGRNYWNMTMRINGTSEFTNCIYRAFVKDNQFIGNGTGPLQLLFGAQSGEISGNYFFNTADETVDIDVINLIKGTNRVYSTGTCTNVAVVNNVLDGNKKTAGYFIRSAGGLDVDYVYAPGNIALNGTDPTNMISTDHILKLITSE
jgi:hypothetical protein